MSIRIIDKLTNITRQHKNNNVVNSSKLSKKASKTFTYHLKTTGVYSIVDMEDNFYEDVNCKITSNFEFKDELYEAIQQDSDINFVKYMHGDDREEVASKLDSITLSLNDDCTLNTTIIANEELGEEDLDVIIEYMEGQFADGWGEGFEQHPIAEWIEQVDEEYEEYDEEEDETYMTTDYFDHRFECCVSWWGNNCETEIVR